jgi:hypothetical protein
VAPPDERTAAALAEMTRLDAVLYRAAAERLAEDLVALPLPVGAVGTQRRAVGATSSAPCSELTFDRSIPGVGWHGRERIAGRCGRRARLAIDVPCPCHAAAVRRRSAER